MSNFLTNAKVPTYSNVDSVQLAVSASARAVAPASHIAL